MARKIKGLTDSEQSTVNDLVEVLQQKGRGNRIRSAYMDCKRTARAISPMLPPYLRKVGAVMEWPAKAVETLARRVRLTGFEIPGHDLSQYGLDVLIDDNRYFDEAPLTNISAFTHSVAWEIVTEGIEGEPDVVISAKSALDGTGTWNKRSRRLDDFLSVVEWDGDGREPDEFNLYLPHQSIMVFDGKVQDRAEHQLWVPVEPLPYRPRLDRPFGASRISRPIMYLTDAAIRALLRMEGTADFYGTPHLLMLGATIEQFTGDASTAATWSWLMNQVNGLPDADDASTTDPALARAKIEQITQASQQPHMDSLDTIAAAFSGAASIPVSSLGVGVKQANPTSADSYIASREDLIGEAEDVIDIFGRARVRTMQNAWLLANDEDTLPAELRKLKAVHRDPRQTSRSAASDATTKLVSAFPWMAQSDTILETLALPDDVVTRLKADKAAATAGASGAQLLADALNRQASAPTAG